MTTRTNPFMATGVALASAGALIVATPAIGANLDAANAAAARLSSLSTPFELLSKSQWQGYVGSSESDDDEDDDHGYGYGNGHSDDGDDDHHGGGGFGNFIADFLAANQAQVLAVTALIPVIYLGPVAVGNSLLATAYYDGYNGSAPGLEGVVSYVTSQFGVAPTNLLQGVVLGLTSLIPQFNIGPVAVGRSLLATAYFSGYNGSATGLPGLISYVTSQLGIQAAPAAAVTAGAVAAPLAASRSAVPAAAASQDAGAAEAPSVSATVAAAPAEAADDSAAESKVDSGSASGAAGRGVASAKAGGADARGKARSARSAAKSAADAG